MSKEKSKKHEASSDKAGERSSLTALIIEPETDVASSIEEILKRLESFDEVYLRPSLAEGLQSIKNHDPDLVVLDGSRRTDEALSAVERISHSNPHTTVFFTSENGDPDLLLRAMRAGAREFLIRPVDPDELAAACKRYLSTRTRLGMSPEKSGKVISVFGVKGGLGTTTIATNVAVNMCQVLNKSVVLVDANFQCGTVGVFLDMQAKLSLTDLLRDIDQIEPRSLNAVLPKHSSGVSFVPPPKNLNLVFRPSGNDLSRLFSLLRLEYDYVIIDLDRAIDEMTAQILEDTDLLLLVVNLDIPSLVNTNRTLDVLHRLGFDNDSTMLVSNRHNGKDGYILDEFEQIVKRSIDWKVPNHKYSDCLSAVNKGVPLAIRAERSKINRSILKLTKNIEERLSRECQQSE